MSETNEISERLKQWVASTGKKKGEIAALLGMSSSQFSQVLTGRDGLGKTMQERLEKAGADVPYILTGRRDSSADKEDFIEYIQSLEREIDFLKNERTQYLKFMKMGKRTINALNLVAENEVRYVAREEHVKKISIDYDNTLESQHSKERVRATTIHKSSED